MTSPCVIYAVDWASCNLIGIPAFKNETPSCHNILSNVAICSPEFRVGGAVDKTINTQCVHVFTKD